MMMDRFFRLGKPFLHAMDAETAHTLTLTALKSGWLPLEPSTDDPSLKLTLWGRQFTNPVGLAAGFDKNAEVVSPMLKLGFGFVEAGTVTPKAQGGNPKPRVFRHPESQAVINRMGFPNRGADVFKKNMEMFLDVKPRPAGIVGINIGMNKMQTDPAKDYCYLIRALGAYADYFTVNISSPNTPGLRNLQNRENLLPLLSQIMGERKKSCGSEAPPPILVKLSPDIEESQREIIAEALLESGIDGIVLTNTTLARPDHLPYPFREQPGGLSGAPLTETATDMLKSFYRLTRGKIPLIGVGGISSGADAYAKIRAGASLVQLYSALVFQGPALVKRIKDDLIQSLARDGFTSLSQAIGADHSTSSPVAKKVSHGR
jgi:dihydroorotate dehydrogenase